MSHAVQYLFQEGKLVQFTQSLQLQFKKAFPSKVSQPIQKASMTESP